jgi:hypothetical protein
MMPPVAVAVAMARGRMGARRALDCPQCNTYSAVPEQKFLGSAIRGGVRYRCRWYRRPAFSPDFFGT